MAKSNDKRKEGAPQPTDVILQDNQGSFYRIPDEKLDGFKLSDDEVEVLIKEMGAGQSLFQPGYQPAGPAYAAPTSFARPTPTGFVRLTPTGAARVAPTGVARVAPTGFVRLTPTGAARVAPTGVARVAPTGFVRVAPTGAARVAPMMGAATGPGRSIITAFMRPR